VGSGATEVSRDSTRLQVTPSARRPPRSTI